MAIYRKQSEEDQEAETEVQLFNMTPVSEVCWSTASKAAVKSKINTTTLTESTTKKILKTLKRADLVL